MGKLLRNRSIAEALADVARRAGQDITAAYFIEAANVIVKTVAQQVAQSIDGGTFAELNMFQVIEQIGEQGLVAAKSQVFPAFARATVSQSLNFADALQPNKDRVILDSLLLSGLGDRRMKDASAEVRQLFVDMSIGGAREALYIDPKGWTAYLRSRGLDPLTLADNLVEGGSKVLTEALETGQAWVVPTAAYLTLMAGSELHAGIRPHITFEADGLTAHQAAKYQDRMVNELTAELEPVGFEFDREAADRNARKRIAADLERMMTDVSTTRRAKDVERWSLAVSMLAREAGVSPDKVWEHLVPEIESELRETTEQQSRNTDIYNQTVPPP